jgi:hypothetical protein
MRPFALMLLAALAVGSALAQPELDAHTKKDIERHKAMAKAHEEAARCLKSGKAEAVCQKELQQRCKGLAIGKFCGMKHDH